MSLCVLSKAANSFIYAS